MEYTTPEPNESRSIYFINSISTFMAGAGPGSCSSLLPDPLQSFNDLFHIKGELHQFQMLLISSRSDLVFDFRFHDMVDGNLKSDTSQWPHPTGISIGEGFSIKLSTVGVRCAKDGNQIILAVLVNESLNCFLTFQVKCTCGRSDEALGLHHDRLGPRRPQAGLDRPSLDAVAFTDHDGFFPFQIHFDYSYRFNGDSGQSLETVFRISFSSTWSPTRREISSPFL